MHPSRVNDGYSYSSPGTPSSSSAQPQPAGASAHGQQPAYAPPPPAAPAANASGSTSRPAYPRRRSAQTPSGLVASASASDLTPRPVAFPQPIFDPDSPFSQPPQGRTIVSPEKQQHPHQPRHAGPSVLRSPHADDGAALERPWGEDALGSPWATRPPGKIRLEDVAEGMAKRAGDSVGGGRGKGGAPEDYADEAGAGQPIAAIRRERGRGRTVVLDPASAYDGSSHQHQQQPQQLQYHPVAGPSRAYPTHHRGQSDDLHNRHHYRGTAPTTPSSYYVPTLQTTAPPPASPSSLATHYQPPRVTSPLPGGGDWGQFVHAELFEEGNSQEEINPYGQGDPALADGLGQQQQQHPQSQSSSAHAFHHPRPRPVLNAHDLEPTPLLEPHSDTSPTFSLPSRSQPGTPASFGVPDYAEHHLHHPPSMYASSSSAASSSGHYQQFQSAQPYNPATLDSFNPAQMHLPPSSFTFTTAALPPPTARVPDYRSHRRIKSIESVVSDYGPHAGGGYHDAIPEEFDEPSYGGGPHHHHHQDGKDDYALNTLVKQVHIQHAGPPAYHARSESQLSTSTSSRAPSPANSYRAMSSGPSPYQEQGYPTGVYSPAAHGYAHPAGTPLILVPHGQPPPPGMVPVHAYPDSGAHGGPHYLRPHAAPPVAPSPGYQSTFASGSPYSTHSPVMGVSEAGSAHYHQSPVLDAPPPPGPPSRETLATRRRSNRRGSSVSAPRDQPLALSSSMSAAASDASNGDSAHYHPYARPSPTIASSSSMAGPSSSAPSTKPSAASKKRASLGGSVSGATPKKAAAAAATARVVDKSAMAALIETLYEPLDADHGGGSESASPPEQLDYDTATGGKGKGKEELKFRCLVEDCDRAFPRRSAIIHHIQMHLSDKPFVCPVSDWCVARPLLSFLPRRSSFVRD